MSARLFCWALLVLSFVSLLLGIWTGDLRWTQTGAVALVPAAIGLIVTWDA